MQEHPILPLVQRLSVVLLQRSESLVSAESCTGGELSAAITALPGSSTWFERGYVTYSHQAKIELLGVPAAQCQQGVVSETVALLMAKGAVKHSLAAVGVAITGIAGPSGGSPEKPVGTVCVGWYHKNGMSRTTTTQCSGNRQTVRTQSCLLALHGLLDFLENHAISK